MAKLKRNFLRGRMNKDLDERLVPNGEYRDALNIQVSTSEGSDVGAIENLLGNTKKNAKPNGGSWDPAFGLNNTKCIGVVRDGQNNKIYWFITGQDDNTNIVNAILEYDQAFDTVEPVLVDTSGVLGFDPEYLITGVNILEGLLYWTDDLNEPKVINIAAFKAGSSQGANTDLSVHTQIFNRNFVEKDITVITEVPNVVLNVQAVPSLIGGPGTGVTPITTNATGTFTNASTGDTRTVAWTNSGSSITWPAGSRVVFTADVEQEDGSLDKYQVTGEFTSPLNSAVGGSFLVATATKNIPNLSLEWEMLLVEDDPIFKNDFPRFSYRYKYTDGRYSVYAPFSKPAFVPGKFEYLSRDGNNEGMNSVIRKITLSGFPTRPLNVEEIEVLYKGASSNNIYVIETFPGPGPFGTPQQVITLDITSGVLGPVVESLQLLRLYDNVPRKAKSQEIVANRIVYGNYLHNYDVIPDTVAVTAGHSKLVHSNPYFGVESVKTDREYQIGISFVDDYGRESPIFTSNSGSVTLNQEDASATNLLTASLTGVPSWAVGYKYYIKDAAPEYYNIALDRYYDSEDGGVWLSFPSAERNKLQSGKYITLKKEHDSSTPITVNNKYKVLDISNEAPEYLLEEREAISKAVTKVDSSAVLKFFVVGRNKIKFYGPNADLIDDGTDITMSNKNFHDNIASGNYISFAQKTGYTATQLYKIREGGVVGVPLKINGTTYSIYEITLEKSLSVNDQWLETLSSTDEFRTTIYNSEIKNRPEFVGRFFAKINANATFLNGAKAAYANLTRDYVQSAIMDILPTADNTLGQNDTIVVWQDTLDPNNPQFLLPSTGSDIFRLAIARTDNLPDYFKGGVPGGTNEPGIAFYYYDYLIEGAKIKFLYSDGTQSKELYTVVDVVDDNPIELGGYPRSGTGNGSGRNQAYTLDRDFDDTQSVSTTNLVGIVFYEEDFSKENSLLSSLNPAIFETEPAEQADLDIYWEASGFIPGDGSATTTLNWFNCYSFGNGVESDRIRDDFNAPVIGKGVRVNAELQEPYKQERRASGLIYGGLYNSLSSVNNTNQFIAGIKITKDLDPQYGGIQKLHSRDTNLVAFAEDKVFRILADKDALYNADGNVNLTSTNRVLGDASTFAGEFGISKNPESFATYGFRAYFADKSRGAVLRLSADGITEISEKGMSDYFIDKFRTVPTPLIGSFDEDTSSYSLVVGDESVSFKEKVDGWPTRLSYIPEFGTSLNNEYYTFKNGELYEHSNATRNNFYGVQSESSVEIIFNDAPSSIKNFKTLAYEGSDRWTAVVNTDKQSGEVNNWRDNEGLYFNFIKGVEATWDNIAQTGTLNSKEFSVQGIGTITAAAGGAPYQFEVGGNVNASLSIGDTLFIKRPTGIFKVGDVVTASNNRITVNDPNNIVPVVGEYAFFAKSNEINISGLLGYYGSVTLTNASVTKSELFGVSSEVFISSE